MRFENRLADLRLDATKLTAASMGSMTRSMLVDFANSDRLRSLPDFIGADEFVPSGSEESLWRRDEYRCAAVS